MVVLGRPQEIARAVADRTFTLGCRPPAVIFFPPWYPLVFLGKLSWALTIWESTMHAGGPAMMLAQQFAQPADQLLRQPAIAPHS